MSKSLYAGTAALLLLLVAGCNTTTGPESGQDGKATVSLTIAGTDSRSVAPNAQLESVARWRLLGGKTGEPQGLLAAFVDSAGLMLYLETGAWNFTLEGYGNESDKSLILRGTITNQEISLNGSNTLNFAVEPPVFDGEGEGTVHIVIKLPDGHGITGAKLVFENNDTLELPITPEGVVFKATLPAGDYYFRVRLYQGEELCGVVSEVVGVGMNLSSDWTSTPELKDLNLLYKLAWDLKGGEFKGELPEEYRSADADFELPQPTRKGYTFKGWHDNEAPVTAFPALSTGDKTFHAQWATIDYKITYILNGGNDPGNLTNYTIEDAVALKKPARDDYNFDGWYDNGGFIGDAIASIPKGSAEDKTFHAKWTAIAYKITYELNGGKNHGKNPETYTVENAVALEKPTHDDDYRFGGWYKDAGFTDGPIIGAAIPAGSSGEQIFYAKWDPGVTVKITLQPQPEDPALSHESLFVDEEAEFSAAGEGYVSWRWRWNGEDIPGATGSSYVLAAGSKTPGVYELSVEATTEDGPILSARCRVVIKAKKGGA